MTTHQAADARTVTRAVGSGEEVLRRVTERVRALRDLGHAGVLVPGEVKTVGSDQVVVTSPWIDGVDLAELEGRRGPLSAGECVWLGGRVASALEALHARGLAHGDVAPANVVIAGGDVVLVDTVAGCLEDERGTVGFRAPERGAGATPAADVYSLGALLRWCVALEDAVPIEAWTAPMVVDDPHARPPVQVAARALASCAPPRSVAVPDRAEVVSALRARAVDRTERTAAGRPWRLRRAAVRVAMTAAVATIAVTAVVAAPRAVDAAIPQAATLTAGESPAPDPSAAATGSALIDEHSAAAVPTQAPGAAAADLTKRRIAALAAGDGAELLRVFGEGPLAAQASFLAADLDAGRVRYEGLDVKVNRVDIRDSATDSAVATVEYALTDHRILTPDGEAVVPAYGQRVELELRWDGEWRVVRARPLP